VLSETEIESVGSATPSWICLGRIVPTVCICPFWETHNIAGSAAQGIGFTAADGRRGVTCAAVLDGRGSTPVW
jgi:hypothetical protein